MTFLYFVPLVVFYVAFTIHAFKVRKLYSNEAWLLWVWIHLIASTVLAVSGLLKLTT